ncbi:MAG: hypothetical protein Fur0037_06660 [Planctomycetota bacterium]
MDRLIMTPRDRDNESGTVLVAVLFLVFLMAGTAGAMYFRSVGASKATSRNNLETQLLLVAETGLSVNASRMNTDAAYAARDMLGFTVDQTNKEYVGAMETIGGTGANQMAFDLRVQYADGGVPFLFLDRANPTEKFTTIRVRSTARAAGFEREIVGFYRYELGPGFNSAFLSDSTSPGIPVGGGKAQAQTGDVVFDDKGRPGQFYLFGGVRANGTIWLDGSGGLQAMTTSNTSPTMAAFNGDVLSNLAGTPQQIPDFTGVGTDQLFDFGRFEAAASAGAGQVFTDIASFVAAMNAANAAGQPLEGITVLKIDSTAYTSPKINTTMLPGGINIRGTLVVRFSAGTDPLYKVVIDVPVTANPADLTGFDPANEATYTTGYPPTFANPSNAPWSVDISPAYENFTPTGDLPALMFENGVVDLHKQCNVCGAVYGPSFIEIENKGGVTQYFNGVVIGGAGIYIEGNATSGYQAFKFSRDVIDKLETYENRGKTLVRTGFTIAH